MFILLTYTRWIAADTHLNRTSAQLLHVIPFIQKRCEAKFQWNSITTFATQPGFVRLCGNFPSSVVKLADLLLLNRIESHTEVTDVLRGKTAPRCRFTSHRALSVTKFGLPSIFRVKLVKPDRLLDSRLKDGCVSIQMRCMDTRH